MEGRRQINCLGIKTFSVSTAVLKTIPYFQHIFELELTGGYKSDFIVLDEDPDDFQGLLKVISTQLPPHPGLPNQAQICVLAKKMGMDMPEFAMAIEQLFKNGLRVIMVYGLVEVQGTLNVQDNMGGVFCGLCLDGVRIKEIYRDDLYCPGELSFHDVDQHKREIYECMKAMLVNKLLGIS